MPRKSLADMPNAVDARLTEFVSLTEVLFETAVDVFNAQDDKTRKVINETAQKFRTHMTGELKGGVTVPEDTLMKHARYLAVEVIKDLAFTGIQIANFVFPANICASCGDVL